MNANCTSSNSDELCNSDNPKIRHWSVSGSCLVLSGAKKDLQKINEYT